MSNVALLPKLDLLGQTIVVTGSSSGIGAATAVHVAARGARVVLHGRADSDRIQQVARLIRDIQDPLDPQIEDIEFLFGDFSETQSWNDDRWDEWVAPIWNRCVRIDHWINNAGADVLTGNWKDESFTEKLNYVWHVDVAATMMLSRVVGERMQNQPTPESESEKRVPGIVNIGWDQADQGMAGESGIMFAATKGAVMAMSKSLAQHFAPTVRVNCVAPGWIRTKWGEATSEYWNQRAAGESLLNRWGTPEDVAAMIGFLCSGDAQFVNGQVLNVNGGFRFDQTSTK
ncbi:MAG: SDR family oxidoreductase [Planctomycetota bacterium]